MSGVGRGNTSSRARLGELPGFLDIPLEEQEALTTLVGHVARSADEQRQIDAALPALYDELRDLAGGYLRRERPDHTLQPTALVHESYLRLVGQHNVDWTSRLQFLSIAARMMRRILASYATARATAKRGASATKLELDDALAIYEEEALSVTGVDEALRDLEAIDPKQAQVVELRFFGGLTFEEIAEVMDVSVRTAKREWSVAKRWLRRELQASNR